MKKIIIPLGSPNDENGVLSQIACDRIDCAYNLYAHNDNIQILCTGGFGEHFNVTDKPHAHYAKQELIRKGVNEKDILPFALSSNTYDDFMKAKLIIQKHLPELLLIVTSDYHIARGKILYERIINYPNVVFVPAKSILPENELVPLIRHEEISIKKLHQQ